MIKQIVVWNEKGAYTFCFFGKMVVGEKEVIDSIVLIYYDSEGTVLVRPWFEFDVFPTPPLDSKKRIFDISREYIQEGCYLSEVITDKCTKNGGAQTSVL